MHILRNAHQISTTDSAMAEEPHTPKRTVSSLSPSNPITATCEGIEGGAPSVFTCTICGSDFPRRCVLLKHLRGVHEMDIPLQRVGRKRRRAGDTCQDGRPSSGSRQRKNDKHVGGSYLEKLQRKYEWWETEDWYKDLDGETFWNPKELLPKILKLPRFESMKKNSTGASGIRGSYSMEDVCKFVTDREIQYPFAYASNADL